MEPKVSILLPTYNGERFLRDAIASVLSQSFGDWELLILDDGSSDGTPKVAKECVAKDKRIRYEPSDINLGIQKTLNRGLSLARGEYIARIDDDDEWADEEKLHLQAFILDSNPEIILVGTGTIVVDDNSKELFRFLSPEHDEDVRRKLLIKNCFTHSSVMFRKEAARKAGKYSEDKELLHVEDYDLWLRLGQEGAFANVPRYAVRFRLRAQNISNKNKAEQLRKDIELVKKYGKLYPRRIPSLIFAYARYAAFRIIPSSIISRLLGLYKKL